MKKLFIILMLLASPAWAAWTDKYVATTALGAEDCSSALNACTLAQAVAWCGANDCSSVIMNVKAGTAGAHYDLAADLTFGSYSVANTTTTPLWWRGYNTSIGDIDADNTLTKPVIHADTNTDQILVTGVHQIFSNINITSVCTDANGAVSATAGSLKFVRCSIINTGDHANASSIRVSTAGPVFLIGCRLQSHANATYNVNIGLPTTLYGCHLIGGLSGLYATYHVVAKHTVIEGFGTNGIYLNSGNYLMEFDHCTVYSADATNAVLVHAAPTIGLVTVTNSILGGCGTGVNNNSGADTNTVTVLKTHFYDCDTNLAGLTEMDAHTDPLGVLFYLLDNDTDPWVAKGSNNYTLASSNAIDKSTSYPGLFEGQASMTSYNDLGAVRHIDPTGGGASFISFLRNSGEGLALSVLAVIGIGSVAVVKLCA